MRLKIPITIVTRCSENQVLLSTIQVLQYIYNVRVTGVLSLFKGITAGWIDDRIW